MTDNAGPAVSMVVITRNQERYIDEALNSLSQQTLRDFEVVIVDDCSDDGTTERIRRWVAQTTLDVRVIVNERNIGICASRNRGVHACRGEFLTGLSGDDYNEPDRLERQHAFFKTLDASVAAVFAKTRLVSEAGTELGIWFEHAAEIPEGRIFERLLQGNYLPATSVMVRRSAVEEVGWYDESLFYEDYDMWLRLADRYEFRYLPEVLTNYRLVPSGVSRNPAYLGPMSESRVRILLKWYGRDASTDQIVVDRAWQSALSAFAADPRLGRHALERVCAVQPSFWRRITTHAMAIPGAHAVAARAYAFLKRRHTERRYSPVDRRLVMP